MEEGANFVSFEGSLHENISEQESINSHEHDLMDN